MKEGYKYTYQVDNLKTQKREFFDEIHIQKQVSWSSGGFDDNISIIDRLETVQQIMEDMKHFLEYGEFLFQDETKTEEEE